MNVLVVEMYFKSISKIEMIELKPIYEDSDLLVFNKPAGIVVFPEGQTAVGDTLIDELLIKYPELKNAGEAPRYGIVHRLDKDTSGIILVAKTTDALLFFQKQFNPNYKENALEKKVEKRYITLVVGNVKNDEGIIETLIGRAHGDKRKQKVYLAGEPGSESKREAITKYKVLSRYARSGEDRKNSVDYTLLEVKIETGRRHQIRCHLSYIQHPVAGDKMYGFKNQPLPKGLTRQFLHSAYLKIQLPNNETKEFVSELPEELKTIIKNL